MPLPKPEGWRITGALRRARNPLGFADNSGARSWISGGVAMCNRLAFAGRRQVSNFEKPVIGFICRFVTRKTRVAAGPSSC